jgi:acid phosphatase type 7
MNRILQAVSLESTGGPHGQVHLPPPVTQLLIAGDLSYADGLPERWDSWLELMQPLLQTLPIASVPGNHEIECDNVTHTVFLPYESQFRNPNRIADADVVSPSDTYIDTLWHRMCNAPSQFLGHYNFGNAFYQYQHGLVHIIALNSYTAILPGSLQYNWLTKVALPNVNRMMTPWLLVMFHCPLYTTFLGHNHEINPTLMKSSIQDLLRSYQVNLVVSGHDHAYLRTHPLHREEVDPTGRSPIYWTLGAGGNREQHARGYIHDTPEAFVAKRDNDEYGYGHLFVKNQTHAHLQWVRDGTSSSEVVRDSVWIENYYYFDETTQKG